MHYSKNSPYLAAIKERKALSAKKQTHHIALDLKGSGIEYQPGDCVAILPTNPPEIVARTLEALKAKATDSITHHKTGEQLPLHTCLSERANLSRINKSLLKKLAEHHSKFHSVLACRKAFKGFQEAHEVWDLLEDHSGALSADELIPHLAPLLPRFYSIASSMRQVGEEVHLTVRHVQYTSKERCRLGVCTHYLCEVTPLHERSIPLYIQPAHSFNLTADPDVPVIMIGPGTGVAPYRAFLQDRKARGAKGANWLFFGEWTKENEFFYQDFWEELINEGLLQLDTAFSRDQAEKCYVQHRMWEKRAQVYQWLENGAHLYLCGDAKQMAPDVEATLLRIVESEGHMSPEAARDTIKRLRKEKRYLKDCY